MNKRNAAGFTLVEMMVVVAVLAVLMGILIPTLGRGMARARHAQCINNLGQHAKALSLYAASSQGRTLRPEAAGQWMAALDPHLGRIGPRGDARRCPEATKPATGAAATMPDQLWRHNEWIGSIAINTYLAPAAQPVPAGHYSTLAQADSATPAFLDGMSFETGALAAGVLPWPRVYERHRGMVNMSFCDGHVEALLPEDVVKRPWRRN